MKNLHPGLVLKTDYLEANGISQAALERHLKWSKAKLSEIINGKRGISARSALALADSFGTKPEFWLEIQNSYDLEKERKKTSKKYKRIV